MNDFSLDDNCVALYNLESGVLTTDSKGTNTLTNSGVGEDLVNFKQGACSGDFDSTDYMYIDDTDLSADFPLKDGDTKKEISVAGWVRFDVLPATNAYMCYITKYNASARKRSFAVGVKNVSGTTNFILVTGHGAGYGALVYTHTLITVATDVWYHFGFTVRDSDKAYKIRIYDESSGTTTETTGTLTYNINVEDAQFRMGLAASFDGVCHLDGLLDEIAIFNDILTSSEIDQIRGGVYTSEIQLVPDRFGTYDPDKFWDEETKAWVASQPIEKLAGGRHKTYLVVVSDRNLVYVGGL